MSTYNDDRIVTLCDMTGGFHTFNIENEETFEMLGKKVKEKLQLEKHTHNVYFFNMEGTEKKHKNDKVDSEPDFRFIVDMINPVPICVEENEIYNLELVRTIYHNDMSEELNEERRANIKYHKISEDSFIYSILESGFYCNYLCTFDEITNEWTSTIIPKNVYHVYPDGSYVEDKRLYEGYSYLNTTVYFVDKYLVIKNKDDNTEIPGLITNEIINSNRCFRWCIPLKNDKYILFINLSEYGNCKKLYVIDAVTTSIIYTTEINRDQDVKFIDNEHIGIHEVNRFDVRYKINFLTGEIIVPDNINRYIGNISYNKEVDTYQYGKVENRLRLFHSEVNQMFIKRFIFISRNQSGKIDILRIKYE